MTGAANDDGGLTMDLTSLDETNLTEDRAMIGVGAGSLWNNVYAKLDPMNITVSGGRVAGIGVGGFLTGGGF